MFSKPPYTITEKAADYLAKIVEIATRLEIGTDFKRDLKLHRENRLRTIHSSLAIEGNTLSIIETVHPFADGNGRMGRLWQTLSLAKWNPIFEWMPMETVLYQNREQYYRAIEDARNANDSGVFIEFTLSAMLDVIAHQAEHQVEHQVEISEVQAGILKTLENGALSRKEIFAAAGIVGDSRAFKRHIDPLLVVKLIEMTIPDKPNSKLQKYRLKR